jgi:hypothetical protein
LRILEAVKALTEGKVIHCPNSFETMKVFEDDLGKKVNCKLAGSDTEQQNIYLTRFEILYKHCDFGMGPFKSLVKPAETKPAKPSESK